jgi:Ca2+/H+ antiporter
MEFIIIALLGILGAALIAGGIVMYRKSESTNGRAFGAAAIAAGVVMWVIIIIVTPASQSSGNYALSFVSNMGSGDIISG